MTGAGQPIFSPLQTGTHVSGLFPVSGVCADDPQHPEAAGGGESHRDQGSGPPPAHRSIIAPHRVLPSDEMVTLGLATACSSGAGEVADTPSGDIRRRLWHPVVEERMQHA